MSQPGRRQKRPRRFTLDPSSMPASSGGYEWHPATRDESSPEPYSENEPISPEDHASLLKELEDLRSDGPRKKKKRKTSSSRRHRSSGILQSSSDELAESEEGDDDLISISYDPDELDKNPGKRVTRMKQNERQALERELRACFNDSSQDSYPLPYSESLKQYTTLQDHDLAMLFTKDEKQQSPVLQHNEDDIVAQLAWYIDMTCDKNIRDGVAAGDLPFRARNDPDTIRAISKTDARSTSHKKQPRIYLNALCESVEGTSITANDAIVVLAHIEKYIFDHDFANNVDSVIGDYPQHASNVYARRYLSMPDKENWRLPSFERVRRLGIFCRALRRRIDAIPHAERDKPMPGGLFEVGYSDWVLNRLKEHRKHRSSNYIMNLVDVLCFILFHDGAIENEYDFDQYVLYHIPVQAVAELSEIYFSRIGQSYIFNGGGFSHCPAGRSTQSAKKYQREHYAAFLQYSEIEYSEKNMAAWEQRMIQKQEKIVADNNTRAKYVAHCNGRLTRYDEEYQRLDQMDEPLTFEDDTWERLVGIDHAIERAAKKLREVQAKED